MEYEGMRWCGSCQVTLEEDEGECSLCGAQLYDSMDEWLGDFDVLMDRLPELEVE